MIIILDYEGLKPLLTAMNAKSPVVGVPLPGKKPLIFRRELLKAALRGITITYAEVMYEDRQKSLIIEGLSGETQRVRSKLRFISLERWALLQDKSFTAFCTKVSKRKPPSSFSKYDLAIKRVKRELQDTGNESLKAHLDSLIQMKLDEQRRLTASRYKESHQRRV